MAQLLLAIIADDLTGALDAAAPFSAIPGGVAVATTPQALSEALAKGPAVVSVSTRSREIAAAEARGRVERAIAALPADVRILKKIDSRLKGNIASELGAFGERPLVVLPAIPDFGRIVRDEALQGFGVDAPIPVRAVLEPLADRALVPDTAKQGDLAAAVAAAPPDAVLVGARGLAQALAGAMDLLPPPPHPALPRPICFVVGSTDPITLAQVDALRSALPDLAYVPAPSGCVGLAVNAGCPVTLVQSTYGTTTAPEKVASALAEGAVPYLQAARTMLLTGGATAEAVLDALSIAVLAVTGEAEPGMAICRAGGQLVVTKSGGFGAPGAFVRLANGAAGPAP